MEPVPMTKARPRLTEIVDDARDHGRLTALTEYGRPRAFVVPVQFVERAERDAEMMARLRERWPRVFAELTDETAHIVVPLRMAAES